MKTVLFIIVLSISCTLLSSPIDRSDLIARQSSIIDHSTIGLDLVVALLVRGAAYLENGELAQAKYDLRTAKTLIPRLSIPNQHLALENAQSLSGYVYKATHNNNYQATNAFLQCSLNENFWNVFTIEYWECNQCHNVSLSRPSQCGCGSISFTRKFSSTDDTI